MQLLRKCYLVLDQRLVAHKKRRTKIPTHQRLTFLEVDVVEGKGLQYSVQQLICLVCLIRKEGVHDQPLGRQVCV